mgnify:CR=1 FL=1
MEPSIYDFIKEEEAGYELPVQIIDGYEWSMKNHIKTTVLYKNSQFTTGKDDNKPFKNIIRPILNLQYRAEGFDVKDIELFINSKDEYYKSFLIKKYHEKWARENGIDTFIDQLVESYVDFGGALVKNVKGVRPEVVPLQSIAFADQTDLLSGPFAIKHYYNPAQLLEMEDLGWGKQSSGATGTLQDVIYLSSAYKKVGDEQVKTTGKYIEVYEVHGNFPLSYLDPEGSTEKYSNQLHICTFYIDDKGKRNWITLFAGPERKPVFKLVLRDEIYGRALGLGGAEELFEPQVWINYDQIRMKQMLDEAAKIIYKTTDDAIAARNNTRNMSTGEILSLAEGKDIGQVDNYPRNVAVFEKNVSDWEAHAQMMGSANDAIMGESPTSGTPFKLQELVTAEGHSIHEYRKGKLATFVEEIYRDWILPQLGTEITKGKEFISELSLEELQSVSQSMIDNMVADNDKEAVLSGKVIPDDATKEAFKQKTREEFMKGGSKRFLKILDGEFKESEIDVYANVAGKQKNMAAMTDKLVNIFRTVVASPDVLSNPSMAKLFNEILESSGLSPMDFGSLQANKPEPQQIQVQPQPVQPQPQQPLV